MLLTLSIIAAMAIAILLLILNDRYQWGAEGVIIILIVIFFIAFAFNMFCLATGKTSTRADIKRFEAVRNTIEQQRNDSLSVYERVQITQTIIEKNEWLAGEQYWANTLWLNWFYDKSILNVKPIK